MSHTLLRKLSAFAVLLLSVSLVAGCSGKPSGFPKVKPCEITVTDGGTAVEGVEVNLIPTAVMSGTIIGGTTDAMGKCVVQTTFANFAAPGAPEGEFSVVLKKTPKIDDMPDLTNEQMANMDRTEIDKYYAERDAKIAKEPKIVPPALTSMQTTPIKANIPADATITVDLSQYK